jgi:hypothetical protein
VNKVRAYFGLALFLLILGVILTRLGFDAGTSTIASSTRAIGNIQFGYTRIGVYPTLWTYIGFAVLLLSLGVFVFAIYRSRRQSGR